MTQPHSIPTNPIDPSGWGLADPGRGARNLQGLATHLGAPSPISYHISARSVPESPDPDLALNALERFFARRPARDLIPRLVADDGRQLQVLVQLFGTSQFLGDVLAADPDFLETATAPLRVTPTRDELVDPAVRRRPRRDRRRRNPPCLPPLPPSAGPAHRRQRHHPRPAAGRDHRRPVARGRRRHRRRLGPRARDRDAAVRRAAHRRRAQPAAAVLGFGKLGGEELNYSSDIDLMFVYDEEGQTTGRRPVGNDEFFARVASEVVRLLSAHTDRGQAYRVDLRLRPEGQRGPLARSLASTLPTTTRWAAPGSGRRSSRSARSPATLDLGAEFLEAIQPFVYKRFLSFAEINEIKAMKRQIEQHAQRAAGPAR